MPETAADQVVESLPGDPAVLHLSVASEIGPALECGERPEIHRLVVRYPGAGEAWGPGASWSSPREHVASLRIRKIPMTAGSVAAGVLAGLEQDILAAELYSSIVPVLFTTRGGRSRFVPAVREVLGKGPRVGLGGAVFLDDFSVSRGWTGAGLDALLLGELVSRTVPGPAVVAAAPFFLKSSQGYQLCLAALRSAGFRPLAGHVMVAESSGLPTLSGPAGRELIERTRAAGG